MPYLLIRDSEDARRVELSEDETTFGRAADNTFALEGGSVSSHHCRITKSGESFTLEDLESTNGTRVNGKRVSSVTLNPGDLVDVGGIEVLFGDENQQQPNPFIGPTGTIRRQPDGASPFGTRKDSKMIWIIILSIVGILLLGTIGFFFRSLI